MPDAPAATSPAPSRGPSWLAAEATIALRLLILGAAVLAALWLIRQVHIVVIAAFLGFALAALLWPVARTLRRVLPAAAAALLCVAGFLAIFLMLFWFISVEVVSSWPVLQGSVIGAIQSVDRWGRDLGVTIPADIVDNGLREVQARIGTVASGLGEAALTGLNVISLMITVAVLTMFLGIFGLTSGDNLTAGLIGAVPESRRDALAAGLTAAFVSARWWLLASTVTGLVDGLFIGLGMHLLELPLAVPIGVLTFVLGFIPMVGATLAGALAVLIGLFFGGPTMALWVLLLVLAVRQIEGNVLSPLLMSRAMQFHPIITLLLTTAGGFTFGLTGLFLAVPLTGAVAAGVRGWRGVLAEPAPSEDAAEQALDQADEIAGPGHDEPEVGDGRAAPVEPTLAQPRADDR
ncbi:MAG: AI-2E family transporter [Austwickia sp.]|nr:AI-2E family transporter [Austwickia sp.]